MIEDFKNRQHRGKLRAADFALADLLAEARRLGVLRVMDGDDVFEVRLVDDLLPDEARAFLTKGGPI